MAQGKEWNKDEVVEVLKPYFQLGYTVNRACELAGLPSSTLKTWLSTDNELRLKIRAWQGQIGAKARENLLKSVKEGSEEASKWWLERNIQERKEFSTRAEVVPNETPDFDFTADEDELALEYEPKK